jgi:polyribonucleotide nucleotidyltransferase
VHLARTETQRQLLSRSRSITASTPTPPGVFPAASSSAKGGLTEKEILTSRMIDRPIRPLFPEGYSHETQVIALVLSADPAARSRTLAIIGAGASLAISDIPFEHVLAAVRVGMVDGKLMANPSYEGSQGVEGQYHRRRHRTRHRHGGIRLAACERSRDAGGHRIRPRVLQEDRGGHPRAGEEVRQKRRKPSTRGAPINKALYEQIAKASRAELQGRMNTQKYEKLESYARIDALQEEGHGGAFPKSRRRKARQAVRHALKERIFRDEMLKAQAAAGWPQVRRGPQDRD